MNSLSPNIQEKLQNIREKYTDRPNSYDKRNKTPTSYAHQQFTETRRSTIMPSYNYENPEKYTHIKTDLSNQKRSLHKQMGKIRQDYVISRNKLFEDYTKSPTTNKGHPKEYIGHIRNVNTDLFGRNRGCSDHIPAQKELKRDYLNNTSKITQKFDYKLFNDKITRQYTLGRQSQRNFQYAQMDNLDRITKQYSKALQKAIQFSKAKANNVYDTKQPVSSYPSPIKKQYDYIGNLGGYERQFGKECNNLHERISFGIQGASKELFVPKETHSKFELNVQNFENSSPIRQIKEFDSSIKDLRRLNQNQYGKYHFEQPKRSSRSMIGLKDQTFHHESPINPKGSWINKFDNVHSKIKGYFHENQIRY